MVAALYDHPDGEVSSASTSASLIAVAANITAAVIGKPAGILPWLGLLRDSAENPLCFPLRVIDL